MKHLELWLALFAFAFSSNIAFAGDCDADRSSCNDRCNAVGLGSIIGMLATKRPDNSGQLERCYNSCNAQFESCQNSENAEQTGNDEESSETSDNNSGTTGNLSSSQANNQNIENPGDNRSSQSANTDQYYSGPSMGNCVKDYFDSNDHNKYAFKNVCGQKILVEYSAQRGVGSSMNAIAVLNPGEAHYTGDIGSKDLNSFGGYSFAVCPFNFQGRMSSIVVPDSSAFRGFRNNWTSGQPYKCLATMYIK